MLKEVSVLIQVKRYFTDRSLFAVIDRIYKPQRKELLVSKNSKISYSQIGKTLVYLGNKRE